MHRLELRPISLVVAVLAFGAGFVGSASAQSFTVRDNFDVASFGNNDGPDVWSGDWIEFDPESGGAGPSAGQVRIAGGFLSLDDQPDTGGQPSAAREVDLLGTSAPIFRFDFQTSAGVDSDDAVTVEASGDGGASWTTLEVITGIFGATADSRSFALDPFIAQNTQVRFRVSNLYGASNETFLVNFAEITATNVSPVVLHVRDNFESFSFGNNDGPDDWSGDWIEDDPESGGAGPGAGQVRIVGGFLSLDDQPDTGGQPSAAREVDLFGANAAIFRFDFQTSAGVDSDDAVTVEASADGGASWTTLEVITGIFGATADSRSFALDPFIAQNTQVRFRVSNLYGASNETFLVAYAEIIALAAPVGETNVPHGSQAAWLTSGTLYQSVAGIQVGDTCSVSVWSGKRSDGGGTWGQWHVRLATIGQPFFGQVILQGALTHQSEDWRRYESTFTVKRAPPHELRLNGFAGFETFDLVELSCEGGANLVTNPSFEESAIPDGQRSPLGGLPLPAGWRKIGGGGHIDPNEVQFNNFDFP